MLNLNKLKERPSSTLQSTYFDQMNSFELKENLNELNSFYDVSPSPNKNMIKKFKPTNFISQVENSIDNYYSQTKPDLKKEK